MNGPIILGIVIAVVFLLMKYPPQIGAFLTRLDKTVKKTGDGSPEEYKRYLLTAVLVFVGVAIAYWGVYSPIVEIPSIATVGSWSWEHLLPLFFLWGIIAALIALNAKRAAKTLQWVLAGVMCALFVVFPFLGLSLKTSGQKLGQQQSAINVAVPTEVVYGSTFTVPVPADGNSMCIKQGPKRGDITMFSGAGLVIHVIYEDKTTCIVGDQANQCPSVPKNIRCQYARDTTGEPNRVIYWYVHHQVQS